MSRRAAVSESIVALNRCAVGRGKLDIDLLDNRGQVGLIDIKSECKLYQWCMLANRLNANLNPATTIPSDVELKSFVAAELGIAFQAFVECGKLLSESTKANRLIQHRSLKRAAAQNQ
jgi:hypothetical protein